MTLLTSKFSEYSKGYFKSQNALLYFVQSAFTVFFKVIMIINDRLNNTDVTKLF